MQPPAGRPETKTRAAAEFVPVEVPDSCSVCRDSARVLPDRRCIAQWALASVARTRATISTAPRTSGEGRLKSCNYRRARSMRCVSWPRSRVDTPRVTSSAEVPRSNAARAHTRLDNQPPFQTVSSCSLTRTRATRYLFGSFLTRWSSSGRPLPRSALRLLTSALPPAATLTHFLPRT